jgi:hypothetical protein
MAEQMLKLHKDLPRTKSVKEKTAIERQMAANGMVIK